MILRRMLSGSLFVAIVVAAANAFSVPLQRSSSVAMMVEKPFFTLPNPFASSSESDQAQTAAVKNRFDSSPDGLIAQAKAVVATDLGVQDESLLAENFMWIGPQLGSDVLGKTDYLAAGKFFDLRSAFPDLDYRAHDFRIDSEDNMTVRLTARTIGTMQGQLRLRSGVLAPINGKALLCPPEAISITFSKDGKVTKLCSGFTMDRLVGNTGGLCGMMAAATVAGAPPSEWEVYPVTTVLNRFIGRPVRQLSDAGSSAPFPEKVMIQLANDIVAENMASRDPDLLGPKFTFCGPYVGPVDKKTFLERYAVSLFGGLEPQLTHFRVDPYDAYRVWVDVRVTGVVNDVKIDISPQAMSFTFDDDGFCTRLTAGAVMDPSVGNSGGLGGLEGAKCAVGTAELDIVTRPLPIVFSRLRKRLLEPMTKIGADDYKVNSAAISLPKSLVLKPESQPEPELPPLNFSTPLNASKKQSTPKPATEESSPILSLFTFTRGNGGDIEVASQENLQEAVVKTAQIEAGFQKAKDEAATKQLVPRKKVDAQKKDLEITRQQTELKKEIDEQAKSAVAAKKAQQAVTAKKEEERLAAAKKQSLLEAKAATDVAKQEAAEKAKAAAVAREQAVEEARVVANKAKVEAAKIVQATVLAKKQEQAGEAKRKAEKLAVAKKLAVDKAKAAAEKLKAVAAAKEQEKAVEAKRQADTKKQAVEKAAAKEQDKSVEAKQQAEKLALAKKRAVEEAKAAADKAKAAAAAKKQEQAVEAKRQTEKLALAKKQAVEEAMAASVRAKAAAAAKKQEQAVETKRQAEKVAIAKKQEAKAAADKAKAVALAKKQEQVAEAKRLAEKLALAKKQAIEEAKMATGEVKRKAQEIAVKPILASKKDAPSMKSASARAPRGVPTLKKWTTNRDGTITGLITGSNVFDENERVTTSVISLGKISSGEVVQTKSGSKYFLS